MTRRAACLAVVILGGCYQSHGEPGVRPPSPTATPDGAVVDAPVTPPPPPPPPPPSSRRTYLLSVIDLPEASGGRAPGANLDRLDSGMGSAAADADCEEFNADFRGLYSGEPGVDDAYGQLVPTLEGLLSGETVRGRLADAIRSGELLLVLDMNAEGPSLRATLYSVAPAEGALRLDDAGVPAPDQAFFVLETLAVGRGGTRGARTRLPFGALSAPLPEGIVPLVPLGALQDVELSFVESPSGLTQGTIAGAIRVEDGVAEASRIMPGIEDTVRSVLESIADLDPGPDPAVCERISVGMTFEAVPAALVDL